MHTVEELIYAQRYPFSRLAKMVLKEKNLGIDEIPEEVIARAKALIIASYKRKLYKPEIMASRELLENEILAFPVAKILLSEIGMEDMYRKFAGSISDSTLSYLESEKDENLIELGSELGIEFNLSEKAGFFVEIELFKFLQASFKEDFMKLVNLRLENGIIYLTKNDFIRFLTAVISGKVLASLPVQTDGVPNSIKQTAGLFKERLKEEQTASFGNINFGSIKPDFFPPCMKELYGKALEGKNLTHLERFTLATFLIEVGMQQEQLVELFSKTPNFSEKVTKYQVSSIIRKKISPPSCAKIRSYKICKDVCREKHPVQYYRQKMFPDKKKSMQK